MKRVARIRTALAASAMLLLAIIGCGDDTDGAAGTGGVVVDVVTPEEFAERMTDRHAVVVNVHVPYEGEIAGTDLFVRFDEVATSPELPPDQGVPLLVYCRTGNMSATATSDLVDAGYVDVTELEGGMVAWQAAGRAIETVPGHAGNPS
jgi:rhodanese-related sulfurtransferase